MSKAFKCDRCKTCFDPYDIPNSQDFVTISGFHCQTSKNFKNNEVCYRDEGLHLCPSCAADFAEFISNRLRAKQVDPCRNVIHLEDKERKEAYEAGFKAGFAYYPEFAAFELGNHAFDAYMVRKNRTGRKELAGSIPESPGEAPQRKKRTEKNGE